MLKQLLVASCIALSLGCGCGSTQPQPAPAPAPIVTVPEVKPEILWREASPETLDLAKKEDKILMVFIYSETCSWCDLMKKNTLQDPKVIERLNKDYVCMKLSAERDGLMVDFILPEPIFPTTIFSASESDAIVAQGYIPPKDMLEVLNKAEELKAYGSLRELEPINQ